MFDIRSLFTRESIVARLKALSVLKTPIMDSVFTDRPQIALPVIGSDLIAEVAHALPVVRRGSASISMPGATGAVSFYEPLPVRPNKEVTGQDLNNLKILDPSGRESWARERTDVLRRAVRKTTEALAAQSLSGQIDWPVRLEGGQYERWTVNFGSPASVTPVKTWAAADVKLAHVFETLTAMQEGLEENGYGSEIEIQAAADAYSALFALAEDSKTTAKIRVEMSDQGINIGGFLVRRRAEKYRDPETGAMVPVVPAKTVRMVAKDAGHRLIYAAVDDLDARLQALPLFIKPIKTDDPSGWKLVAESKPFPVVNVKGVCTSQVLS